MVILLPKIINVRVTGAVARAVEARVASDGGTVSDFGRWAIERALCGSPESDEKRLGLRHRAATLQLLAGLATDLKKLGGAHIYGLKAHRLVEEGEATARLKALEAIEAAVRDLVRP